MPLRQPVIGWDPHVKSALTAERDREGERVRRQAGVRANTVLRRREFRARLRDWAVAGAILLIGFALGFFLKSCCSPSHAAVTPSASPGDVAFSGVVTAEEWAADFIRAHGTPLGIEHADGTARAVVEYAPLLRDWLSYRDSICLLMAVIWKESTFDPQVSGTSRDRGLMQLVEGYHGWRFAGQDWRIPHVNVRAGTGLLAEKFEAYGGDLKRVLTRYNGSSTYPPLVLRKMRKLQASWDAAGVVDLDELNGPVKPDWAMDRL